MTTLTVQVDNDNNASLLKEMLTALSFVEQVEISDHHDDLAQEPSGSYKRLKKVIDETDGSMMFQQINDPVEWQKKLRDEW